MNVKKTILFLMMICAFGLSNTLAQAPVTDEQYEHLRGEIDFSKTKEVWKPKKQGSYRTNQGKENIDTNISSGGDGVFTVLGYFLLGGVVIGVFYMVLKDVKREQLTTTETINLDDIEDIASIDFDQLLKEALVKNDYRLALRLKFLIILNKLTQTEKIKWKPYKTNRIYIRELKNTPHQSNFRNIANIFEYIWYGVSDVNLREYEAFSLEFESFLNSISHE